MKITRILALHLLAIQEICNSQKERLDSILQSRYLDSQGESINYESVYGQNEQSFLIQQFVENELVGTTNNYLEHIMVSFLKTEGIEIVGKEDVMIKCNCCDYYTIVERGEYEICSVCFWEDDGTSILSEDTMSQVNRFDLKIARANFVEFGAYEKGSIKFVQNVDRNRFKKD